MPFSDNWGTEFTKVSPGVYELVLTRDETGREITRTFEINDVLEDDEIDRSLALVWAIKYLFNDDPPDFWRLREQYALARWKMAAYAKKILDLNTTINSLPDGPAKTLLTARRNKMIVKRNYWVEREEFLRSLVGE
jgi:hypothetical protein